MKGKSGSRRKRKRSTKGRLVRAFLERVSINALLNFFDELKPELAHQPGIYALYHDDDLHYVGMSKNLLYRIDGHRRDRHKSKWNYFSAYVLKKSEYSKDLEAIVLRLGERPGNKVAGKFPRKCDIRCRLGRAVRERLQEIKRMFWLA